MNRLVPLSLRPLAAGALMAALAAGSARAETYRVTHDNQCFSYDSDTRQSSVAPGECQGALATPIKLERNLLDRRPANLDATDYDVVNGVYGGLLRAELRTQLVDKTKVFGVQGIYALAGSQSVALTINIDEREWHRRGAQDTRFKFETASLTITFADEPFAFFTTRLQEDNAVAGVNFATAALLARAEGYLRAFVLAGDRPDAVGVNFKVHPRFQQNVANVVDRQDLVASIIGALQRLAGQMVSEEQPGLTPRQSELLAALQLQVGERDARIKDLLERLESANTYNASLLSKIDLLEKNAVVNQRELEAARQAQVELERQIAGLERKLAEYANVILPESEARIAELEQALADFGVRAAEEKARYEDEITQLRERLATAEQEVAERDGHIAELTQQFAKLEAQLREKVADYEEIVASLRQDQEQLKINLELRENDLALAREANADLEAELEHVRAEQEQNLEAIAGLTQQLTELERDRNELLAANGDLHDELAERTANLERERELRTALERELAELQAGQEELRAQCDRAAASDRAFTDAIAERLAVRCEQSPGQSIWSFKDDGPQGGGGRIEACGPEELKASALAALDRTLREAAELRQEGETRQQKIDQLTEELEVAQAEPAWRSLEAVREAIARGEIIAPSYLEGARFDSLVNALNDQIVGARALLGCLDEGPTLTAIGTVFAEAERLVSGAQAASCTDRAVALANAFDAITVGRQAIALATTTPVPGANEQILAICSKRIGMESCTCISDTPSKLTMPTGVDCLSAADRDEWY